jgi:tetratricopeptide (TPR) repeat protein
MMEGWRSFNYVFLVVYPAEKEADIMRLLGALADETAAFRAALDTASAEIYTTSGNDLFFAWYNRGTSLVNLQDFTGAAEAYDQAFALYPELPLDRRPWRMVWYQTGPYFAYYYTGRYGDVVSLATQTIDVASEPYLEESWYWRARAREMLGDRQGAVEDLRQSLVYHPEFTPSLAALQNMGVTP